MKAIFIGTSNAKNTTDAYETVVKIDGLVRYVGFDINKISRFKPASDDCRIRLGALTPIHAVSGFMLVVLIVIPSFSWSCQVIKCCMQPAASLQHARQ